MTISSDDPNQPSLVVKLTGKGSASAAPNVNVTPVSLDFGIVNVGQSSQPKMLTVTNTGTSPVTVNLSTSAPFTVSPASLTLAANGGPRTASVTFTPNPA